MLFKTNNLEIIARAAQVLDVPVGDSTEDVERRRFIISKCYRDWKLRNPSMR